MKWSTLAALAVVLATVAGASAVSAAEKPRPDAAWPMGLGTIDGVVARYPVAQANAAALRLTAFAAPVGIDFTPSVRKPTTRVERQFLKYLETQIARADDRVDPLPPDLAAFFRRYDPQLNAIRDLLIGWRVVWPLDLAGSAPLPNLRAHTTLTRILVVRALAHSSWPDLQAAANLQRALSSRPELISQLVSTGGTRLALVAARKLPAPAPAWTAELLSFDARRGLLGAVQAEAWRMKREMQEQESSMSVGDRLREIILKPFDEIVARDYDEMLRRGAADLAASSACAFDGAAFDRRLRTDMRFRDLLGHPSLPNVGSMWQRVARMTAEREATAIVLALKAGRNPPLRSGCSDGSWMVRRDKAGAYVRFSRSIPIARPQVQIPLEYSIR